MTTTGRNEDIMAQPFSVMPGREPGIHAGANAHALQHWRNILAWMAGTSPAMTD